MRACPDSAVHEPAIYIRPLTGAAANYGWQQSVISFVINP